MEYEYEHINVDSPGEQWVEELAQMLAEIIYREMMVGNTYETEEQ